MIDGRQPDHQLSQPVCGLVRRGGIDGLMPRWRTRTARWDKRDQATAESRRQGGWRTGELDFASVPQVWPLLESTARPQAERDLGGVEFSTNSAGLVLLVEARDLAARVRASHFKFRRSTCLPNCSIWRGCRADEGLIAKTP